MTQFKAKLVPTSVSIPLFEDMVAQQKQRSDLNREQRKAWWNQISHLPERMARAENANSKKNK